MRVACAEKIAKFTPPAYGVAPRGWGRPGASAAEWLMRAACSRRLEDDGRQRRQRHPDRETASVRADRFRGDRRCSVAHATAGVLLRIGVQHFAPCTIGGQGWHSDAEVLAWHGREVAEHEHAAPGCVLAQVR